MKNFIGPFKSSDVKSGGGLSQSTSAAAGNISDIITAIAANIGFNLINKSHPPSGGKVGGATKAAHHFAAKWGLRLFAPIALSIAVAIMSDRAKLCSFWSGEIRDSIGSIVSNRHNISHGRQVAVSLAQILAWTENAEKFCEKLEDIIIPNR
jgi:hypothetical protein